MTSSSNDEHLHYSSALNERIDALVLKLDDLITAVGEQDRLRKETAQEQDTLRRRLNRLGMAVVVTMASVVVFAVMWQNRENRVVSCESQNSTRGVVRDLLVSAQKALAQAPPPLDLATEEQKAAYRKRLADAKSFYGTQIDKVSPLSCNQGLMMHPPES